MRNIYTFFQQIMTIGWIILLFTGCNESPSTAEAVFDSVSQDVNNPPPDPNKVYPIPDITVHSCGTYSPIASLKFECEVRIDFNYQYNYLEFSSENTCTWLSTTEDVVSFGRKSTILSGTPAENDDCHLSFYLTDGKVKSNTIDLDLKILSGKMITSYEFGHYENTNTTSAGDINNDGIKDIMITSLPCDNQFTCGSRRGKVQVLSGSDQSILFDKEGLGNDFFGYHSIGIGDINSDGHDDIFIVANINGRNGTYQGTAYSGKDQSELYTLDNPVDPDNTNRSLLQGDDIKYLGDIQKNGIKLFAIVSPYHIAFFKATDGSIVHIQPNHRGRSIDVVGDIDKDGYKDIVIGNKDGLNYTYSLKVISGKDFSETYTEQKSYGGSSCSSSVELGIKVGPAGDPDQDGYADFFYTHPCSDDVYVVSPFKLGTRLYSVKGQNAEYAGDVNGDTIGDIVTFLIRKDYTTGGLITYSGQNQEVLFSTSITQIKGEGSSSKYIEEGVETYGRNISVIYDMYGDGKNYIFPTESYIGDYDRFYYNWWIFQIELKAPAL